MMLASSCGAELNLRTSERVIPSNIANWSWPDAIAHKQYQTDKGLQSLADLTQNKQYMITMLTSSNCHACKDEYKVISTVKHLFRQSSRCAFVVGGYDFNSPSQLIQTLNQYGVDQTPIALVGNDDIIQIYSEFYQESLDKLYFPFLGVIDTSGQPVEILGRNNANGKFQTGAGVLELNQKKLEKLCT